MLRKFMFSGVMFSAVVVPYVMSTGSEWWTTIQSKVSQMTASAPADPAQLANMPATNTSHKDASLAGHSLGGAHQPSKLPVEGYAAQNLGDVINFNATPQWIMMRWPRVTVGLAELDMQGYRVPLVTGTGYDDLAGSLTYYFDNDQRVKLIHFRGTTGDPRKIVGLVMQQYNFLPQPTGDPALQLYQVKWNGKPISELRVQSASVLRSDEQYSRFAVESGAEAIVSLMSPAMDRSASPQVPRRGARALRYVRSTPLSGPLPRN